MVDHASITATQEKLVELLLRLFSLEELRRFGHRQYPKLATELPEGTSHRAQTESLVGTLERHGELDEDFFASLREERQKRAAEVGAVAALFASRGAAVLCTIHSPLSPSSTHSMACTRRPPLETALLNHSTGNLRSRRAPVHAQ